MQDLAEKKKTKAADVNKKTAATIEEKLKPGLISMATLVARPDFAQCPDHVCRAFTTLYKEIAGILDTCEKAKRDGRVQLPAMCSTIKDLFIVT